MFQKAHTFEVWPYIVVQLRSSDVTQKVNMLLSSDWAIRTQVLGRESRSQDQKGVSFLLFPPLWFPASCKPWGKQPSSVTTLYQASAFPDFKAMETVDSGLKLQHLSENKISALNSFLYGFVILIDNAHEGQ